MQWYRKFKTISKLCVTAKHFHVARESTVDLNARLLISVCLLCAMSHCAGVPLNGWESVKHSFLFPNSRCWWNTKHKTLGKPRLVFPQGYPPCPSNWRFVRHSVLCLSAWLCVLVWHIHVAYPPEKVEGSWVKDEIESEGHWVCRPYLHGRCHCSRRCVHCYTLNVCGVGLLKNRVHVRRMIL